MDRTDNHIEELQTAQKSIFIDFFATWCAPCQMFDPIWEELKTMMGDQLEFIKIDIDLLPEIAIKYEVKSVPTLLLIKNGEEKWRMPGFLFAKDLKKIIEPLI